jgi:hypothetical protein
MILVVMVALDPLELPVVAKRTAQWVPRLVAKQVGVGWVARLAARRAGVGSASEFLAGPRVANEQWLDHMTPWAQSSGPR